MVEQERRIIKRDNIYMIMTDPLKILPKENEDDVFYPFSVTTNFWIAERKKGKGGSYYFDCLFSDGKYSERAVSAKVHIVNPITSAPNAKPIYIEGTDESTSDEDYFKALKNLEQEFRKMAIDTFLHYLNQPRGNAE